MAETYLVKEGKWGMELSFHEAIPPIYWGVKWKYTLMSDWEVVYG
jgi:hypothetical protein